MLAPLAPDANANASAPPPPPACGSTATGGGGLSVAVLAALGVRDAARLSLASDSAAVALDSGAGCDAGSVLKAVVQVAALAAANVFSVALLADGSAYAWGNQLEP